MLSNATVLFAGGGSGGHLYPGISVAESLSRSLPGIKALFLCTQRPIDTTILSATPFEFVKQPILPPRRSVGGLIRFWRSWRATHELVKQIITERAPAAVLGLGGYAAGVAVKLASKAKIPAAILNPDVIPGKANQYLLSYVQKVCCQFDATREHVDPAFQSKLITTGCPIRADIRHRPPREQAAARLGLDPLLNTLVVTGASQGAVTVNEATIETISRMMKQNRRSLQGWQVLHLSGPENAERVRAGYRELPLPAAVLDFTPAMADVWSLADLAICRAGASTCAELTTAGVPAILLPYPFHKDKHQMANARVLADANAAILMPDECDRTINANRLQPTLEGLLRDADRRRAMADACLKLARPDAADSVAKTVAEIAG